MSEEKMVSMRVENSLVQVRIRATDFLFLDDNRYAKRSAIK